MSNLPMEARTLDLVDAPAGIENAEHARSSR